MTAAAKLQIKPGHRVALLGLPAGVDPGVPAEARHGDAASADAVVVFVTTRAELDERAGPVADAARRDALAWVAYPKAGQLGTDLNRDSLAAAMGPRGVRPVRQVAVDDVWSALRFRAAPP